MTFLPHPSVFNSIRHRFSREEDEMLRTLVLRIGSNDWATVAQFMPGRSPRQCSHRYNNYLTDRHRQTAWTEAEERVIFEKYREIGPKWAYISKFLAGRTGNDVKNRWHKHLVKRAALAASRRLSPSQPADQTSESDGSPTSPMCGMPIDIAANAIVSPAPRRQLSPFLQFALNQ
jgi:hypothetical protein